jgi:hypothetical protein
MDPFIWIEIVSSNRLRAFLASQGVFVGATPNRDAIAAGNVTQKELGELASCGTMETNEMLRI